MLIFLNELLRFYIAFLSFEVCKATAIGNKIFLSFYQGTVDSY